ncbi:MAG: diguanylate cyclase [Bacillota bacterium]|nr:diguanylate cyclase [Bacillota bacterium]
MDFMLEREEADTLKQMSCQYNATYRQFFQNVPVGLISIDSEGRILDCNDWIVRESGLSLENMLGKNVLESPNLAVADTIKEALKGRPSTYNGECEVLSTRRKLNLSVRFSPNNGNEGVQAGIIGVVEDASKQVELQNDLKALQGRNEELEKQLTFLAEHDGLTGLFNRIQFEMQLQKLDEEADVLPVALIICDLDGLKRVNDSLGVSVGDECLFNWARIMENSLRDGELFRIGGDEFAIVLPGYGEKRANEVYESLKSRALEYNKNVLMPFSVSMGYSVRETSEVRMNEIFKQAEQNMCRQKLFHQQSGRRSIVEVMGKMLEARDRITDEHTDRMQDLIIRVGEALDFNEQQKQNLLLLARFHDIGKVGIADGILNKPGKLTVVEYEEMKKHSEIGFRIARAADDLFYIADWILKHHERWDGTGYPIGLKGEEIPVECRILSVVDAYDAIVSDRPYRKAMSHQCAIQELAEGAGSQFDPEVVRVFRKAVNPKKEEGILFS